MQSDKLPAARLAPLPPGHHPDLAALAAAVWDKEGSVEPGFKRLIGHVASRAAGCRYCMAHTGPDTPASTAWRTSGSLRSGNTARARCFQRRIASPWILRCSRRVAARSYTHGSMSKHSKGPIHA